MSFTFNVPVTFNGYALQTFGAVSYNEDWQTEIWMDPFALFTWGFISAEQYWDDDEFCYPVVWVSEGLDV